MMNGFKEITYKIQEMDLKEVDFWRNSIIIAILVNILGIYWFLGLKSVSVVLLFFLIGCLGILIHNSKEIVEKEEKRHNYNKHKRFKKKRYKGGRRHKRKMNQQTEQKKEDEEDKYLDLGDNKEETKKDDLSGFGEGLPSSEEYNKRMKDQFGSFDDL